MQHSHSTHVFKPLIPLPPTLYLLPCTLLIASYSWLFFCTSCFLFPPDSLNVLQWNAGGLRARSTELFHFVSPHSLNLFVSKNLTLTHFSLSRSLDSLLSKLIAPTGSGILSLDVTHASGGIITFVRQGLSFSELSTFSLFSLVPYSDCVGMDILLNNSSSLSVPNV